jgi:hypothetical protein
MIDFGKQQNDIPDLFPLDSTRYENIFKLYKDPNSIYFYNILNNIIVPDNIDQQFYYIIKLNRKIPWTTISYEQYGTIDLWWFICLVNKINNPIKFVEPGAELKVIRKNYLATVLNIIQKNINL